MRSHHFNNLQASFVWDALEPLAPPSPHESPKKSSWLTGHFDWFLVFAMLSLKKCSNSEVLVFIFLCFCKMLPFSCWVPLPNRVQGRWCFIPVGHSSFQTEGHCSGGLRPPRKDKHLKGLHRAFILDLKLLKLWKRLEKWESFRKHMKNQKDGNSMLHQIHTPHHSTAHRPCPFTATAYARCDYAEWSASLYETVWGWNRVHCLA